jgi:hypothetical protein
MKNINNPSILFIFLLMVSSLLNCCSLINQTSHNDGLPILSQDELIRPYTKLGRIQVTRETYWSDNTLSPEIKAWGLAAVRQEAEKMGADAIMLPEVTGHRNTNGLFPSTEYIATGFAIKFK